MPDETAIILKPADNSLAEKVKLIATVIGIVGPILALLTFVGFKPEKKKALEWEYVSKTSLVNPSAASPDKIEVTYGGRKIKQLTAISAKLSNTGSITIDSSDIEDGKFPEIALAGIISVDVKGTNRTGIRAVAKPVATGFKIEHGMLNPGDSIFLSVLVENLPENTLLPRVSYRIRGIEEPSTRYPTFENRRVGIAYLPFSPLVEYYILTAASLSALLCVGIVVVGMQAIVRDCFPERRVSEISAMVIDLCNTDDKFLTEHVARTFHRELPHPISSHARDAILKLARRDQESIQAYAERVAIHVTQIISARSFIRRLSDNKGECFGLAVIISIAIASGLILIGSWHRLITGV